MAKGMPKHTGDPNIEAGSFEKVPDGNYIIKKISRFISTDDSGNPIFVEQNGRLVVRLEFEPNIPCSASPAEFWGIVRALGGNVDVPPQQRTSPQALVRALDSVNNSPKTITVTVRNGWVNGDRIVAAGPAKGKYLCRFAGAHRPDFEADNYHFAEIKGKNGVFRTLIFDFEILGNMYGKPTLYDGYVFSIFMNDPFTTSYTDLGGNEVNALEVGVPLYARDERTGGIPMLAQRWDIFARYFAPTLENHDWQVDPLKSDFGICEVEQPQYVFINYAKKDDRKVVMYYKEKTRGTGMTVDLMDVPVDNGTAEQTAKDTPATLSDLLHYITERWPEMNIFDTENPTLFTDEGREWAKQFMGGSTGPWVASGLSLENRKALSELTPNEITALLAAFRDRYGGW